MYSLFTTQAYTFHIINITGCLLILDLNHRDLLEAIKGL